MIDLVGEPLIHPHDSTLAGEESKAPLFRVVRADELLPAPSAHWPRAIFRGWTIAMIWNKAEAQIESLVVVHRSSSSARTGGEDSFVSIT